MHHSSRNRTPVSKSDDHLIINRRYSNNSDDKMICSTARVHKSFLSGPLSTNSSRKSSLENDSNVSKSTGSKKLPQWLLDMGSGHKERTQSKSSDDSSTESLETVVPKIKTNGRPISEMRKQSKPSWFEEMLPKTPRRHSDDGSKGFTDMPNISVPAKDKTGHLMVTDHQPKGILKSPSAVLINNKLGNRKLDMNSIENSSWLIAYNDDLNADVFNLDESPTVSRNMKKSPSVIVTKFDKENASIRSNESISTIDGPKIYGSIPEFDEFIIPELPKGKLMKIDLLSNWGDEDFIGMNGIEIFDANTKQYVKYSKICMASDHESTGVDKLLDSVNRTHDDNHIWLIKFNRNRVRIVIEFEKPTVIALIRIWNYNKSRIYSYRGVKDVVIALDDAIIFRGEIAKSYGILKGPPEKFGDTIIFTRDETILEGIGQNDKSFQELLQDLS